MAKVVIFHNGKPISKAEAARRIVRDMRELKRKEDKRK